MGRKGQKEPPNALAIAGFAKLREKNLEQVTKALKNFRFSFDRVYTFELNLCKEERAAIHIMVRKMGMKTKSTGYGDSRRIHVYKRENKNKQVSAEKESPSKLGFSDEAATILLDLFTHYPPDDAELNGDAAKNPGNKAVKIHRRTDIAFCRPTMSKNDILKKVEMLTSKINEPGQLGKIFEARSKLPISSFKDQICSTLENHQVVLIAGETGCGKTTQVPQYILDHVWGKGESCKIVCTQPRRISAMSVAERISAERGESVGDTVGYKIRMESKGGKDSSIMFCTNGVLLRLLIGRVTNVPKAQNRKSSSDDAIMEITHIIVDEIHERDRFSDFTLAILRDLLPMYPHLHMVLMSATVDAGRFSQYFNGCPVIQVPGHTYPVQAFYLEDVLSTLQSVDDNHLNIATDDLELNSVLTDEFKSSMDEVISMALVNDEFDPLIELISVEQNPEVFNYPHSETGVTPLMVFAGKGQLGDVCMLLSFGVDCSALDHDGKSALDWAQQENQKEVYEVIKKHMDCSSAKSPKENELLNKYLASMNPEQIDTVLIERLLKKICVDSSEGAILIFLPGWDDINRIREKLLASSIFGDLSKFLVLSLHSMIPSSEQKKVFKRPPAGVRKIILSTNIAETAVTIDDVVVVIDSGRMKEKSYDPYNNVSTLQTGWVSRASARQREGRAGRCQPGFCYHLYSRVQAASMLEYQIPEIQRMPIEELCLQVKLLKPNCKIANFLKKTLDPPVAETVKNAITVLQDLGALTHDEQLTDLGEKLGSLPVHPSTSKMLLFGILMNCLDPALTLACAANYRDPFFLPMAPDERKRAVAAKVELASLYGGFSDQLAVVAAFDCWRCAKDKGQQALFCSKYFVTSSTMKMLSSMRKQLRSELVQRGFLPADASACSLNAKVPGIISAVLVAGAYPRVGRLLPPHQNARRAVVETASGAKVRLHPRSSNFNLPLHKSSGNPLLIYDEITRGDGGLYINKCSVVGSYPLLLHATEMAVAPPEDDSDKQKEGSNGNEVERNNLGQPKKEIANEDEAEKNNLGQPKKEITNEDEAEKNNLGQPKKLITNEGEAEKNNLEQPEKEIMSSADNIVSVVVDRWLRFNGTALDVAQIYCLRARLAAATLFKVKYPCDVLPPALGATMCAIANILAYDGLPAMVPSTTDSSNLGSKSEPGSSAPKSSKRKRGLRKQKPGVGLPDTAMVPSTTDSSNLVSKSEPGSSAPKSSKRKRGLLKQKPGVGLPDQGVQHQNLQKPDVDQGVQNENLPKGSVALQ